jgi:hypothetical protein
MGGLELEEEGPLSMKMRWQVLCCEQTLSFRAFLAYDSPQGGGGPPGDPRMWVQVGEITAWEPGSPPVLAQIVEMGPGPGGESGPAAAAVRISVEGARVMWLGPVALAQREDRERLQLLPAAPNPFNPETLLRYTLPPGSSHAVRMEIRDIRGRRIATLVDEVKPSGSYAVRWDGREKGGRDAAAGIYLVVLEVDGRRLTRKILLLR